MFQIKKLRADHVIDFAAEELKKYLRMMMPECGDIPILYEPGASEGFRLGLAEDFRLSFPDVRDPFLDDVVHIDTDVRGGILAGGNPRSVLFAVYRYLKENGCRFLYPGVDGEYIPVKEIVPVKYHHLPSSRFRGQCNEGSESQQCMLDTIDFYAKLEMNIYMLEFDTPFYYYDLYYRHVYNEDNRPPEPVGWQTVKQWKRQCETEIARRGLQFHDMGHGWTAEPFGLDSSDQWRPHDAEITEEIKPHLAMIDGERKLYKGVALNTNLCMSNPATRAIMAGAVADYAANHPNAAYIHVWLADGSRNHCECEECRKLRPSDYYVMIMNQLDEELTRRKLNTRIVFIVYLDTLYAPVRERIKNPERFAMLYAPIQRSYTSSVRKERIAPAPEYVRNAWPTPVSPEENAAFLLDWQKEWHGSSFCYEYHFFTHLFRDPGMMDISRRIYEDILSIRELGLEGMVEDGTQRGFFPNGFAMYIYAEALLDCGCDYEAVKKDYFSHIYGEHWEEAAQCLNEISRLFDVAYMEGERSAEQSRGKYYNPAHAEKLRKIRDVAARERKFALSNAARPVRVQTVSMRLLLRHAEYCELAADMMAEKALGNDEEAARRWKAMCSRFGRYEIELERYFDHYLAMHTLHKCLQA